MKTTKLEKVPVSFMQNLTTFVNPLTADDKYYLLNRGNLLQDFQMQLSQKRKSFLDIFFQIIKFRFNFENFQKKDDSLD